MLVGSISTVGIVRNSKRAHDHNRLCALFVSRSSRENKRYSSGGLGFQVPFCTLIIHLMCSAMAIGRTTMATRRSTKDLSELDNLFMSIL